MNKLQRYFDKNGSTILSVIASIGVIGTAVLSGKATYDSLAAIHRNKKRQASKKEKVKVAFPYYIPAIFAGSVTISCIAGANILNKKRQASLVGACALLGESYRTYKDKVKELQGEEFHNDVISKIASEKYPEGKIPENKVRFYDEFSKRYFDSTMEDVVWAIYKFNRNFQLRGVAPLNEFYEFLGIEKLSFGDDLGFNYHEMSEGGLTPWIDIHTARAMDCDGKEFYIIQFDWDPIQNYEDWEPSW